MKKRNTPAVLMANAEQRKALSSPIRLEILGQFTSPGGMSIADVAERIGRPTGSLYYHFRIMEELGLLVRVGVRPGVKRQEALFEPVASRFEFPTEYHTESDMRPLFKTVSSAFRMTERDIEAAIRSGVARTTGPHRNFFATRLHCRIPKKILGQVNHHMREIEKILEREARRKKLPADANQYCALTMVLTPLRGREHD